MSTTLFPISYKGDFIAGKFVPVVKGDGEFKDISPADLNDVVMTVPYKHDNIDEACSTETLIKWVN